MKTKKIIKALKLFLIYILTGAVCGVLGTLFAKGVVFVTSLREDFSFLIFLLPLAGILSIAIYKWLNVTHMGTDDVIASAEGKNVLSPKLTPAVFLASLLSHLCGASVGREGAALQLGGSSATFLSRGLRLKENEEKTLIYCGMAGVFSSVFGTPLAAAVFALEIVFVGHICLKAVLPVFTTSFVSFFTAKLLGAHSERFVLSFVPDFSFSLLWKILLIGLLTALLGIIFCFSLRYSEKALEKMFKNPYLRIVTGSAAIILLTIALGTYDYNGAGVFVIERIFNESKFVSFAFALKLLFTVISVSAGFKGGEIVPTLFIGATFGAFIGTLLGLPAPFSAAICMCALFCAVTNCPLASILLAAELFSFNGVLYIALAVIVSFFLSGKISLYSTQKTSGFKNLF